MIIIIDKINSIPFIRPSEGEEKEGNWVLIGHYLMSLSVAAAYFPFFSRIPRSFHKNWAFLSHQ